MHEQCKHLLKSGAQCKLYTRKKNGLCWHHQPAAPAPRFERPEHCSVCYASLHQTKHPLSCGHWVHKSCIVKTRRAECPMCRATLPEFENLFPRSASCESLGELFEELFEDPGFQQIEISQEMIVSAVIAFKLYANILCRQTPRILELDHFISGMLNDILPISHPEHTTLTRILRDIAIDTF